MILYRYPRFFERDEAFYGSFPGWYVVEETDCDTIIIADGPDELPFPTREDALADWPSI